MALPSTRYASIIEPHTTVQSLDRTVIDHQTSAHHSTAPSQSLFQNARNVEVKDTQITAIANANVTINNNTTTNDPVSTILWPHVVAGAIFNSAAQYGAGKCHPGTRKKIIERIVAWIEDPEPTKRVLWIYGPAGAGKSAIAQTICELLKESYPDNDGGSFFFSNGPSDRGNALRLFTTLAYQLAVQFPSIRTELNDLLSHDPSLPTKSMEIQLLSLIIQPLLRCQPHSAHSPVLIIDGLDECDNDKGTTQGDIIALISKSVIEHNIPLRFMILSRPEYWIRDVFDTAPLPDTTLSLSLRDDVDADKDIRAYLIYRFERIRVENKRFMRSVVPPWPPTKIVDRFVEEASGQYIYAATVLKFVGNLSKFSNPQKQLDLLTFPGPYRALAFSELDRLYATILSAYPEWETMRRVLAALLLEANITIITVVLGVDPDELALVLDALSSLIDIKKRDSRGHGWFLESIFDSLDDGLDVVSFCHRSFGEFLQNETRSGAFYLDLDLDTVPKDVMVGYFDMIHRNLDQNYEIEPHIFLNIDPVTYSTKLTRMIARCISHCNIDSLLLLITHLTAKLKLFYPGRLTRVSSVFYFIRGMEYFQGAFFNKELLERPNNKEKPEILKEFQIACQNLKHTIDLSSEGALFALASCTDFKVTPTLVYLAEFHIEPMLPLDDLRALLGVADVISTLRQHRYILPLLYNIDFEIWVLGGDSIFKHNTDPGWRTQGAWRDLRISFVYKSLISILADKPNQFHSFQYHAHHLAIRRFFDSGKISDIRDEEYFQNPSNLAILAVMTDLAVWIGPLNDEHELPGLDLLVPILCWINRQLANQTNPETVTLLQNHDNAHHQRLETVMKYIFEQGFLKAFSKTFRDELCAFSPGDRGEMKERSIAIKVSPLPGGFSEEKMGYYEAHEYWSPDLWQAFHGKVFGKVELERTLIDPIIHPSQWHPYLAFRLLLALVRFLYGQIHREFSNEEYHYEESFPYLIQCLPYAQPTAENLDALRAIVYLYPQVTPAWDPPDGFWPLLVNFLEKYDCSLLSSEGKHLFELWLNSTEHADIKTYIDK